MNTWPSIYREGALALSPDDVAKGNREMDALMANAARSIARRENFSTILYSLWTATLIVGSLGYLICSHRKPPATLMSNCWLVVALLSVAMLAVTWRGWTEIQHWRVAKRLGDLSGVTIPPPLQELIDSFASGVREVRNARGDKVLPGLFASRWAIMLFSDERGQRLWVRGPKGQKYALQIYAEPNQSDPLPSVEAPPSPNVYIRPQDEWLAGDDEKQFHCGLSSYLAKFTLKKEIGWERTVLSIGRTGLRKGLRQKDVIEEIIEALKEANLPHPDLENGESASTIKTRLQGWRGKQDIKRYFTGETPPSC